MTQTLALFPLELVVFPQEKLALHVFENRYQQLIADCEEHNITFGVPAFINRKMQYGTEVKLEKVVKRYPSGASDIICHGLQVFKIDTFYNTLGDRLYAGAEVTFRPEFDDANDSQRLRFTILVKELYDALDVDIPEVDASEVTSYTFSHKIGLSLEQEHHLIKLPKESDRLTFLIDHLSVTIPVVRQMNRTREAIKLNGRFKNFDPLDFTEVTAADF